MNTTPTPDQTPVDRAAIRQQLAEALWARAQQDIVAEWICCDPVDQTHHLCVQGDTLLTMVKSLIFGGPVTLADAVLDTVLPAAVDRGVLRDRIAQDPPAVWVDGHPQLEAIAAAVWERCRRSDSGACVDDDPRNIAVAALAAVLPAPADRAAVLRQEAARIRAHCPDHLDANSAWLVCHCDVADDMERRLAAEAPQTSQPTTVLLAAADRAEQTKDGVCRCSWCETCCGGCTGCACHHIAAELRRTAAEAQPATPDQPRRGDQFEAWLKAQRDEYEVRSSEQWHALDEVLDTYRLHADTGTPLGEHVCEGKVVGDCECLEQPAGSAAASAAKDTPTDDPDGRHAAALHFLGKPIPTEEPS